MGVNHIVLWFWFALSCLQGRLSVSPLVHFLICELPAHDLCPHRSLLPSPVYSLHLLPEQKLLEKAALTRHPLCLTSPCFSKPKTHRWPQTCITRCGLRSGHAPSSLWTPAAWTFLSPSDVPGSLLPQGIWGTVFSTRGRPPLPTPETLQAQKNVGLQGPFREAPWAWSTCSQQPLGSRDPSGLIVVKTRCWVHRC